MFAGEHCSRPASFEIGIWTFATLEFCGPMTAMTFGFDDERCHVLGAGLRVVDAVLGVVEDHRVRDLDLVAAGRAAGFLDRELDAVDHRLRCRRARCPAAAARCAMLTVPLASPERRHRCRRSPARRRALACTPRSQYARRERANLAQFHPVSSSKPIDRVPRSTSVGASSVPSGLRLGVNARRPMLRPRSSADGVGDVRGSERRCVTDDGAGTLARAARRLPPKRCRIIDIGGPNATPVGATRAWLSSLCARHPARSRRRRCEPVGSRSATDANHMLPPTRTRCTRPRGIPGPTGSHHGHRTARRAQRRLASVVRRLRDPLNSADLLRQLVYLPQASIFIAEARREVVGGAVLALRPSVRAGGFVGAVDLLVVDPDHDADRVTDALLEEILRSARNKGCTVVEAALSDDPAERTRLEASRVRRIRSARWSAGWPRSGPPGARSMN